jgi:GNAT superfamily N-acetyltransferase
VASDKDGVMEEHHAGCMISTDPAKLDLDVIHGFLSRAYWCEGIPRHTLERAIQNSMCFGVYADGRQVGFARIISDRATFAYLADVFVVETHRGRGLSKWMMQVIMAHPDLQGLRRWSLGTLDAHGLYSQYGFTPPRFPDRLMEIYDPHIYKAVPMASSEAKPEEV